MRAELQEQLYKKFPKIFAQKDMDMTQTAMCWGISCGDGWYGILDTLCFMIQNEVDMPVKNIERCKERIEKELASEEPNEELLDNLESMIKVYEKRVIGQIEAVQVKEKFGSLRFYIYGDSNDRIDAFIDFAESISESTCEICGKYGAAKDGAWIKVRCDDCA